MSELQPGDFVDIAIKGVRVAHLHDSGAVTVVDEDSRNYVMPPQAAVTRVAPDVRPGDLWRGRLGSLWFAIESDDGRLVEMVSPATGSSPSSPAYVTKNYGPLERVHREGVAQ